MFERFTDRARAVTVAAIEIAKAEGAEAIGPSHLLHALSKESGGIAADALRLFVENLETFMEPFHKSSGRSGIPASTGLSYSDTAKKIFELTLREAMRLGDNYVGTEHILLALIREETGEGVRALVHMGVNLEDLKTKTEELHYGATVRNSTTTVLLFCNGVRVPLSTTAERYLKAGAEKAAGHNLEVSHLRD